MLDFSKVSHGVLATTLYMKTSRHLTLYKARLQRASNLSRGLTRAGTVRSTGLCTDKAGDDVTDDWSQVDGEVGTIGCETRPLVRMYAASQSSGASSLLLSVS